MHDKDVMQSEPLIKFVGSWNGRNVLVVLGNDSMIDNFVGAVHFTIPLPRKWNEGSSSHERSKSPYMLLLVNCKPQIYTSLLPHTFYRDL